MAKELALHQSMRKRSTIDSYHRLIFSIASRVNRSGDQLFAGTCFTTNQHRCIGRSDTRNLGNYLPELGMAPYQFVRSCALRNCFLKVRDLNLQRTYPFTL